MGGRSNKKRGDRVHKRRGGEVGREKGGAASKKTLKFYYLDYLRATPDLLRLVKTLRFVEHVKMVTRRASVVLSRCVHRGCQWTFN